MTSFLFSPHENLIFGYSVAAAEGTTVIYSVGSTLHQLPLERSGCLVHCVSHSVSSLTFPALLNINLANDGGLERKKGVTY